jgi:hypothetical protein
VADAAARHPVATLPSAPALTRDGSLVIRAAGAGSGRRGRGLAALSGLAGLAVIGRDGHERRRMGNGRVLQAVLNRAQGPVAVIPPA